MTEWRLAAAIVLGLCAAGLAYRKTEGWGWFLLAAVLALTGNP